MRRTLVVGNWKMHGSLKRVDELLEGIKALAGLDAVVCPPYLYIEKCLVQLAGTSIAVGAQNVSAYEQGAYTGEIAATMLKDLGCEYAIIGHSERRSLFAETDAVVVEKFIAARRAGLKPIVCVGESLDLRQAGKANKFVAGQLRALIDGVGIEALADSVIAYEPIWAIGTGETATAEQAQDMHANLRAVIAESDLTVASAVQILYGGSVNAANAAALFAKEDIDGALVGGASLSAEDFGVIGRASQ